MSFKGGWRGWWWIYQSRFDTVATIKWVPRTSNVYWLRLEINVSQTRGQEGLFFSPPSSILWAMAEGRRTTFWFLPSQVMTHHSAVCILHISGCNNSGHVDYCEQNSCEIRKQYILYVHIVSILSAYKPPCIKATGIDTFFWDPASSMWPTNLPMGRWYQFRWRPLPSPWRLQLEVLSPAPQEAVAQNSARRQKGLVLLMFFSWNGDIFIWLLFPRLEAPQKLLQ